MDPCNCKGTWQRFVEKRPALTTSHFNFQILGFVAVTAVLTAASVSVTQIHASAEIAEKVAVQQRPSVHVLAKVSALAYSIGWKNHG